MTSKDCVRIYQKLVEDGSQCTVNEVQDGINKLQSMPRILIVINMPKVITDDDDSKAKFEDIFKKFDKNAKFSYLSEFNRVKVLMRSSEAALIARKEANDLFALYDSPSTLIDCTERMECFFDNHNNNQMDFSQWSEEEIQFSNSTSQSPLSGCSLTPNFNVGDDYDLLIAIAALNPGGSSSTKTSKIPALFNAHHKSGEGNMEKTHQTLEASNEPSQNGTRKSKEIKNECLTKKPSRESSMSEITNQSLSAEKKSSRESSMSEITNSCSAGDQNHVISSKVASFSNMRHKPGGGNVKIFDRKLDFSTVGSRCGSKHNIKHKAGGGNVQIFDEKQEFSVAARSKIKSLKNVEHKPGGGDVKIDNRKLEWQTSSKVRSLSNVKHKPGGGNVQILNQQLPWLKHNKPNLSPDERARINKRSVTTPSRSQSTSAYSDRSL